MIKTILSLVAFLLCASSWAQTEISREEASKIKTYDLSELNASMPAIEEGKIIKLKFSYRSSTVEKQDDGSLRSMIQYYGRNYESGYIRVRVPKEAVSWFMKLPYGSISRQSLLVFAKITKENGGAIAELVGREMKTDAKGPKIIW